MLFFVLSGFVLSLGWLPGEPRTSVFLFRRICRIWFPFAAVTALALALKAATSHTGAVLKQGEMLAAWKASIGLMGIARFLALIFSVDCNPVNGSAWSLVHEMRISLAFPFLVPVVLRMPWKTALLSAFALSFSAGAARLFFHPSGITDVLSTVHFAAFFFVGCLIAAHRKTLAEWTKTRYSWLIAAGTALYLYPTWFFPHVGFLHIPHISDWTCGAGSSILIACAPHLQVLRSSVSRWLGRVSYSLYLCHLPILLTMVSRFGATAGTLVAVPATIGASALLWRAVERPSIALGRRWKAHSMSLQKAIDREQLDAAQTISQR
jgi:peptidoglycan/LPS O-acetylase OafA/YrhL